MGSSEIYQAVEGLSEIRDSLVVDLEFLGRDSFMPLFVVLMPGCVLDETLRKRINEAIKSQVSRVFYPMRSWKFKKSPERFRVKSLKFP